MMSFWCYLILVAVILDTAFNQKIVSDHTERGLSLWGGSWTLFPTTATAWSLENRIPMTADYDDIARKGKGKFKMKKTLKQFMMPLLLAYKLKFFTLIPILVGGLLLLTASTGIAGFFFALFAAAMGLKSGGWSGH